MFVTPSSLSLAWQVHTEHVGCVNLGEKAGFRKADSQWEGNPGMQGVAAIASPAAGLPHFILMRTKMLQLGATKSNIDLHKKPHFHIIHFSF